MQADSNWFCFHSFAYSQRLSPATRMDRKPQCKTRLLCPKMLKIFTKKKICSPPSLSFSRKILAGSNESFDSNEFFSKNNFRFRLFADKGPGWFILGDLLLRMPLSIFCQIVAFNFLVSEEKTNLNISLLWQRAVTGTVCRPELRVCNAQECCFWWRCDFLLFHSALQQTFSTLVICSLIFKQRESGHRDKTKPQNFLPCMVGPQEIIHGNICLLFFAFWDFCLAEVMYLNG